MDAKIVQDGHSAVVITASGMLEKDLSFSDLVSFDTLNPVPLGMRLDSVVFAIQEKAVIQLWWVYGNGKAPMLCLESRGRLDWEAVQGITSDKGVKGIGIEVSNVTGRKHLTIAMDFTKQL